MNHKIEITTGTGHPTVDSPGRGRATVRVDGQDVSNLISGYHVDHHVNGSPTVELRLASSVVLNAEGDVRWRAGFAMGALSVKALKDLIEDLQDELSRRPPDSK